MFLLVFVCVCVCVCVFVCVSFSLCLVFSFIFCSFFLPFLAMFKTHKLEAVHYAKYGSLFFGVAFPGMWRSEIERSLLSNSALRTGFT